MVVWFFIPKEQNSLKIKVEKISFSLNFKSEFLTYKRLGFFQTKMEEILRSLESFQIESNDSGKLGPNWLNSS